MRSAKYLSGSRRSRRRRRCDILRLHDCWDPLGAVTTAVGLLLIS
jgi:hypothetical protein